MAESDVATAPPEISPPDNQPQDSTPPPPDVAAAAGGKVSEEVEKVEEVEETAVGKGEEVAAGKEEEEVVQENQDLKRKLEEVHEETERQAEGVGSGEDGEEGSDAKRQRTETEEAERSGEGQQEEPAGPENAENAEHDGNNNGEQAAEGDVQKEDFTTEKAETEDGSSETTRTIEVPNHRVGVLIGKAGDTIRNMQKLSGARIQIVKDSDTAPDATTRMVELLGSVESIDKAEQLIKDVLAEADAGRPPPLYGRGFNSSQSGTTEIEMQVPNDKVGSIIGKGGQMIKDLQARSGAHILLVPTESSEEEDVKERTVRLTGNKQQVEAAKYMIKDVINQTGRSYPPNRGGSGPRQNYGSRGPGSYGQGSQKQWGQPRQHHQSHSPGYNKYPNQRGKNYPQQFPQNPRQSYGKYPPARTGGRGGGTGSSWDQRAPYQQPSQYGASGGPQYGQQQQSSHGYGAPNPYQQNALPPQQSYQTPPPQQYYGQQATQPGYQQQPYNAMYPQGQVAGGNYAAGGTAQAQNPYAMGQYGQGYSQPAGTDAYSQQYAQQYPQQPGQVAAGYSQVAPAYNQPMGAQGTVNYGYQTGVADPSTGYNAGTGQASYGQVMPATQAGFVQEQAASQGGYDQGAVQPAAAGPTAQASGAPVAGAQWQG